MKKNEKSDLDHNALIFKKIQKVCDDIIFSFFCEGHLGEKNVDNLYIKCQPIFHKFHKVNLYVTIAG